MNKWQQQVYDMLRAAGRNNLPCTIPADVTHIPANMMLEADKATWICVEERLPENDEHYLVWCSDNNSHELALYFGDGEWLTEDLENITRVVTHWMPLPKPPEGE